MELNGNQYIDDKIYKTIHKMNLSEVHKEIKQIIRKNVCCHIVKIITENKVIPDFSLMIEHNYNTAEHKKSKDSVPYSWTCRYGKEIEGTNLFSHYFKFYIYLPMYARPDIYYHYYEVFINTGKKYVISIV